MSFKYPIFKSDNEAQLARLLPQNDYDFEVVSVKHGASKTSNPQLKILLKIFHPGGTVLITDYLLLNDKWGWKLRHFAQSIGLLAEYEGGTFDEKQCAGRKGKFARVIQRDGNEQYPPSNSISDYVSDKGEAGAEPKKEDAFVDSDIPY